MSAPGRPGRTVPPRRLEEEDPQAERDTPRLRALAAPLPRRGGGVARHERRVDVLQHDLLGDDALGDVTARGDVVHEIEHHGLQNRPQSARPGLARQCLARHSAQRAVHQCAGAPRKTDTQHIAIPPTNLLRQALLHVILAGFGMDSSFLNLSFTW